ncbi:hypothetical protein MPL3365_70110 [Mesorhizobium plurifarium]|uniref:Uncharacterized protein n=1 Tax=Mesorhizobium plurifarium TaxID=69974 RepID=A0A090GBL9_MESPL|nr:hypothetical protein MPL3365_70110 [Mesorhizobium plurifarium]
MASLSMVVPSAPNTGNRPLAKAAPTCTDSIAPSRPSTGIVPTWGSCLAVCVVVNPGSIPWLEDGDRAQNPECREAERVGWWDRLSRSSTASPSSFQGGARSEATRADPGIHAVTLRRCYAYRFCTAVLYAEGHGMDPRVKPEDDEATGMQAPSPIRFADRPSPQGEGKTHPAMASGTALLLGIWMSISSVDMVAPRSIETWR